MSAGSPVSGLAMPSLKPMQVARRGAGRAGGLEKPSMRHAHLHAAAGVPGDVAQRVQHGVGAARAELQAQVAAALGRVEVVVGESGHRDQPGGP